MAKAKKATRGKAGAKKTTAKSKHAQRKKQRNSGTEYHSMASAKKTTKRRAGAQKKKIAKSKHKNDRSRAQYARKSVRNVKTSPARDIVSSPPSGPATDLSQGGPQGG